MGGSVTDGKVLSMLPLGNFFDVKLESVSENGTLVSSLSILILHFFFVLYLFLLFFNVTLDFGAL